MPAPAEPNPKIHARTRWAVRVVACVTATAAVFACATRRGSTTDVTSGTYDVDVGACMCRLPQDELMTCCRSSIELTCRCDKSWCHMVPSGRTCREQAHD